MGNELTIDELGEQKAKRIKQNHVSNLRETLKDFDKELRKSRREAVRAWALTYATLYTGEFTFASIEMSQGALSLLGEKLSQIGTALALQAELLALEKRKKSINKKTMETVLNALENEAQELSCSDKPSQIA